MKVTSRPVAARERPTASFALEASARLWESFDTPVSLSCWLKAKYGEWDQLVTTKVDPLAYLEAETFWEDYQSVSLLSKAEFLQTTFDRREAAKATFLRAEALCRETNLRFDLLSNGRLLPANREVLRTLERARRLISKWLGRAPLFKELVGPCLPAGDLIEGRFGPGATSVVSQYVCAAEKYRRRVDVTPALYPYLRDVCGPRWFATLEKVSLLASNRVSFVPKNAKTFRSIAVEPHVNGYAQLGVAAVMRRRLEKIGVVLETQADRNRLYASIAQALELTTMDLSMASDTVSRGLVMYLLPEDWWSVLDTCRSHYGVLDGIEFEYEKFSSMGNGFTFELETLIFRALAIAAGGKEVEVFGDDIITETAVVPLLREALDFCGFVVNEEKSFSSGPFRESCGHDYFDGVQVRPFFWKDLDVPSWFKVCNDLREIRHRLGPSRPEKARNVLHAWLGALRALPRMLDIRVPPGYDGIGVVDDDPRRWSVDQRRTALAWRDGWEGLVVRGLVFEPFDVPVHASERALLHCLDGGGYEGTGNTSFRDVGRWTEKRVYVDDGQRWEP